MERNDPGILPTGKVVDAEGQGAMTNAQASMTKGHQLLLVILIVIVLALFLRALCVFALVLFQTLNREPETLNPVPPFSLALTLRLA